MTKILHIIQHVPYEGPTIIRQWAIASGFRLNYSECWSEVQFPQPEDVDGLVVLGGYMNVGEWDKYPWLQAEVDCISSFLKANKPVLGLCLGGQLLAHVLGAKISVSNQAEIGVWPVTFCDKAQYLGFAESQQQVNTAHWHQFQFALPKEACLLMQSEACPVQGFIYKKNVIALQCHFEADSLWLRRLCAKEGIPKIEGQYVQSLEEIEKKLSKLDQAHPILEKMLRHLFGESGHNSNLG